MSTRLSIAVLAVLLSMMVAQANFSLFQYSRPPAGFLLQDGNSFFLLDNSAGKLRAE